MKQLFFFLFNTDVLKVLKDAGPFSEKPFNLCMFKISFRTMLARWYDLQRKEAGKGIKVWNGFITDKLRKLIMIP